MTSAQRPGRPARSRSFVQVVLEVVKTAWVTPHIVRVTLGGPGFADFEPKDATDSYVKITFVKPELGLEPPYDFDALKESLAPEDLPVTRTYTVRRVNQAERTIDIDFVVHGDEGIAGPWAARAQVGERIAISNPGGAYKPDVASDWHLFVGDESALPAIAAALEALHSDALGVAFLEIESDADIIELQKPEGVEIVWVKRGTRSDATTTLLAAAVSAYTWPEGRVQVFAHGERESMKALRGVFLDARGLGRDQLSLSGYWAAGRTEDKFQAEKREPIGVVLP